MAEADGVHTELLIGSKAKKAIQEGMVMTKEYAAEMSRAMSLHRREDLSAEVEAGLTVEQRAILKKLRAAKSSEERVKVFAKFADDVGLDPLLSLVPALGDGGSSIVSGIYLLFEARKAGLSKWDYLKIIGLQATDCFVGSLPLVGDVADYFFKANKWSGKSFEQQTAELVKKAREAGVPEEKIAQIQASASRLPQLANKGIGLYGNLRKVAGLN